MKVEIISKNNFHSVKDEKLLLDGITILLGVNGCVKSIFLKAFYYFYEPKL